MQPEFGAWVREARMRAPMTQQHLADAAGLSVRTLGRIENGREVSAETVQALRSVLEAALGSGPAPVMEEPASGTPVRRGPRLPSRRTAARAGILALVALLGFGLSVRTDAYWRLAEALYDEDGTTAPLIRQMEVATSTSQMSGWRQAIVATALAVDHAQAGLPLVRTLSSPWSNIRPMGVVLAVPGWDDEGTRQSFRSGWWTARALSFSSRAPMGTVSAAELEDVRERYSGSLSLSAYSRATAGGWAWQEDDGPGRPALRIAYGPTDTATCRRAAATTAAMFPGRIRFGETDAAGLRLADAYTPPPRVWRDPFAPDGCRTVSGTVMLHARLTAVPAHGVTP